MQAPVKPLHCTMPPDIAMLCCGELSTGFIPSAACAASGNDYQKERQFKKINSQKDSIEGAMVRSGKQTVANNTDGVVGDVLLLNTGDKVGSCIADCPCCSKHQASGW